MPGKFSTVLKYFAHHGLPLSLCAALAFPTVPLLAGGVVYTEVGTALGYERQPSSSIAIFDAAAAAGLLLPPDWGFLPMKPHGAPGVVIFDYDGDGDEDFYVTNGPGVASSLFQNQLAQSGQATFLDVAWQAGVDALADDSSGVCAGDTDNDGDPDLLVVSPFGPHRLFVNQGDGTFADATSTAGLGGSTSSSVGCSFGDVDNDGLIDLAVANTTVDMSNGLGLVVPFDFNQHNELFLNIGGNEFIDVSATSGIWDTTGFQPAGFEGSPTLTWALALVDVDRDGDVDLVQADDQAGVPFLRDGGVDRGLIHVFLNDGSGFFTDQTGISTPPSPGAWMGLSFGDVDGDGHLDLFGSNLGDYATTTITSLDPQWGDFAIYFLGDLSSRWYLGGAGGSFSDPGLGSLTATPFGWGTSMADYDNDADTDILFHGGLNFGPVGQGSPAALLENDGSGIFNRDAVAFASSTDHEERTVQGVAMGDLDGNGFADVVSVSNFDIPAAFQTTYNHHWGSAFDGGRYAQIFAPTGDLSGAGVWADIPIEKGTLSVELNSGNGNGWAKVRTLGTVGITTGGTVNRDGIGAVVEFTTAAGHSVLRPVIAGASYASQDSLEGTFGMGTETWGRVEITWPGGTRNVLYGVRPGEEILFPEIPCSLDDNWSSPGKYFVCVQKALHQLKKAKVLTPAQKIRFFKSALIGFFHS